MCQTKILFEQQGQRGYTKLFATLVVEKKGHLINISVGVVLSASEYHGHTYTEKRATHKYKDQHNVTVLESLVTLNTYQICDWHHHIQNNNIEI